MKDCGWVFRKIVIGQKCCLTCKRFRDKTCLNYFVMVRFLKEARTGKKNWTEVWVRSLCSQWK